ncbi:hypothetical protein BGZ73_004062 [Actinomortierella ambigua]|nr:hypothetical protein BGZ73_004062 [Actinomortierella ambigua]
MENTPFLANYQDYRAQSPVREQFAMLQQQQQQHPRHGSSGSRFQAGYGSSSDDGLDGVPQEHLPRQPLQYPIGSQDHPPSSPVMSEHSINYRAPHLQQQQQPSLYYTQGGMPAPGLVEDRAEYNRIDPYRSALSQQQHLPPSSSTSSPFLGPQSIMMYHNNNNSTISGHSQHGLYDDAPSSYDSRLSMLGQHPARSHHFTQQQLQHQQQQGHFPLVLLDSHRSESEIDDRPLYAKAIAPGHRLHQPSQADSAGTEDRYTKQSGMEDDDDLSEGARRARAAIIAAHQGAAGHFPRGGMNSTSQRSDAANTSGTATQDLIQGENKSSSTSDGSGGGGTGAATLGAAAGVTSIAVASKGSKKSKKGMMGSRHEIDSEEDELEEGQEKGALRRREPRCCCGCLSRRACVYTTFLSLIVLAIVLFFLSPRVPVFAFDSARSDEAPVMMKNHIEEPFVLRLRIDNTANWVPLSLNHLDFTMYYKLEKREVGNNKGLTKSVTFQPRKVQYMEFPMMLSYTSSWYIDLNSDGVLQDLIRACTPMPPSTTTAPLGINVQIVGKLSVWGLAWMWKPEFTIDVSNMPCPINAPPPPIDLIEPPFSANTTPTSTTPTASTVGAGGNTSSTQPSATMTSFSPSPTTASS